MRRRRGRLVAPEGGELSLVRLGNEEPASLNALPALDELGFEMIDDDAPLFERN